jgi:hypothetical protein
MRSLIATLMAGCVIASAHAQNAYDGAQAVEPLPTQQLPSAPSSQNKSMDCDFEHHCYPDSHGGGSSASANPAPNSSPPSLPQSQASDTHNVFVHPGSVEDSQILREYAACMGQAVGLYNQSHNLGQFARMSGDCQIALEVKVDHQDTNYSVFGANQYPLDPASRPRRNIGCGYWPIGSDADRACAAGRFQ